MSEKSASLTPVLIASSLKPVKDTRAWGKLGSSLQKTGIFQVNFMGFSQNPQENCKDENLYPSFSSQPTLGKRVLSQVNFSRTLFKLRPKILIVCTYEYLSLATFFKRILGYKLIYDVQENYVKNLELNPTLSSATKRKTGKLIRLMEKVAKVDLYLLAEKCYAEEMPEKSPFLILENKYEGEIAPIAPFRIPRKNDYSFLISGTLTPAFGTLEAIHWFREILKKFPAAELKIIGHCPLADFQTTLQKACENTPQIQLQSSIFPVPHEQIIAAYPTVDFAILAYQNSAAVKDKIPTKLFESAALGLPVLVSPNPKWQEFIAPFSGGISIDFSDLDNALKHFEAALKLEYFTSLPGESVLWKSQHEKFITAITSL
ncbi:glycosyltransferase [Algoriphagus sp. NG3]|uniref:glycosyltransferase n=1 Tax=Algoriphagus sp. NG3 TaxID=3097546 RepID=UPI002A7F0111|nr:glycosyltransferase [Algoriphagus sp. NG3]WPR76890.1 glycosyltransferase [Algoriphagus sp. NG3]